MGEDDDCLVDASLLPSSDEENLEMSPTEAEASYTQHDSGISGLFCIFCAFSSRVCITPLWSLERYVPVVCPVYGSGTAWASSWHLTMVSGPRLNYPDPDPVARESPSTSAVGLRCYYALPCSSITPYDAAGLHYIGIRPLTLRALSVLYLLGLTACRCPQIP